MDCITVNFIQEKTSRSKLGLTKNSARLTDQRGSHAFCCSPFFLYNPCTTYFAFFQHRYSDIGVYYLFSRHSMKSMCERAVNKVLPFDAPSACSLFLLTWHSVTFCQRWDLLAFFSI